MANIEFIDFSQLTPRRYGAEFDRLMAAELDVLAKIASDEAEPSPANIIEPWEFAHQNLETLVSAFYTQRDSDATPELDALQEQYAPIFAAHHDAIFLNRGLYERLVAFEERIGTLDEQDAHWLTETLKRFRRNGIGLSDVDQTRLREINSELAALAARYEQLVVAGRNAAAVLVTEPTQLAGLSDDDMARARAAAEARGLEGWLLELVNTTGQPWLDSLDTQEVRKRIFEASASRGDGDEFDTRELIVQTARLRAERAQLLGFVNHAEYVANEGTAADVAALTKILHAVRDQAMPASVRDAKQRRAKFAQLAPGKHFEAWDWQWVAAHQRADCAVSDETLRPYLAFERVLADGVFAEAGLLYGLTFRLRHDLSSYVEDARVFEVFNDDGSVLGGLIVDPYARPTKQGGAWMTDLRVQNQLRDELALVSLNCNFDRPTGQTPTLLSWDEVITLFHEFGHCLNGLFSECRYPSRGGANGPRDYVEFPSQVNEHWAWEPSLIKSYARHWQTDEPLPDDLVAKLRAGRVFDLAWQDVELVAAMLLDQAWHTTALEDLPEDPDDVAAFEQQALAAAGVANELIPPRYRTTYFSHIWGGGYAAAYYGYLWSAVLDADAVAWFEQNGGLRRENGERFRREVLSKGDSVDLMSNYVAFRGQQPDVKYLLERHRS